MKRLSRLFLAILVSGVLAMAPSSAAQQQSFSSTTWLLQPLAPVSAGNVQLTGNPGPATYYFWVVANYLIGNAAPAGPFTLQNGPNGFSGSNFATVNWQLVPGAVDYDVLMTTTPAAPTGACNCAVATGVTGLTQTVTSNSLSSYTVVTIDPTQYSFTISVQQKAAGLAAWTLSLGNTVLGAVDNTGTGTGAFAGGGGGGNPCTITLNSLQTNNAGAFGCASQFTYSGTTLTAGALGNVDFSGGASTKPVQIASSCSTATALGRICVNSIDFHVYVGNGTAPQKQLYSTDVSVAPTGVGIVYSDGSPTPNLTTVNGAGTAVADIGTANLDSQVANDTTTGTTVNLLAKLTSTGAIITATGDNFQSPAYIVSAGAGTTGNARLCRIGICQCKMDVTASNTEGQLVFKSVTGLSTGTATAGRCSTSVAGNIPPGTFIIGKLVDNSTTSGSNANILAQQGWWNPNGTVNNQTGTSYAFVNTDGQNTTVTFNNASATAVTLPQAGSLGFARGWTTHVQNYGAGTVTITPTTSTIGGSATLTLAQNQGAVIESDGTNYGIETGKGTGGGGAFGGGLGSSYQDVAEIAAPSNPSSGNERLYADSTAHQFKCLTSTGGNCLPSSGGSPDANALANAWYIADGGAANGITGTTTTTYPGAYAVGQTVYVKMNASNTGATTININSLGNKNVTKGGASPLILGDLLAGHVYPMTYDGTEFVVTLPSSNILIANGSGASTGTKYAGIMGPNLGATLASAITVFPASGTLRAGYVIMSSTESTGAVTVTLQTCTPSGSPSTCTPADCGISISVPNGTTASTPLTEGSPTTCAVTQGDFGVWKTVQSTGTGGNVGSFAVNFIAQK